jgi:hypothetical protein
MFLSDPRWQHTDHSSTVIRFSTNSTSTVLSITDFSEKVVTTIKETM